MKIRFFVIAVLLQLAACQKNIEHNTLSDSNDIKEHPPLATEDTLVDTKNSSQYIRLNFNSVNSKFKLANITQIDSSNKFNEGSFIKLSEKEYAEAFQDTLDNNDLNQYYYFSNQGEYNGFRRYIYYKYNETCCMSYLYNVYDKTGKLTSSITLTSNQGEAEITLEENGKILNDTTVIQSRVECIYEVDKNDKEYWGCDSSTIQYRLTKDGNFAKDVLFNKRIKRTVAEDLE